MVRCRRSDTGIVSAEELEEARAADLFWRGLRVQAVLAYLIAGIAVVLKADASAGPYVLAFLVLLAAAGTVYMTHRIRAILAPHRDRATGELAFKRPRLRLADVIGLPSAVRDR
jgi:hypothetical protein